MADQAIFEGLLLKRRASLARRLHGASDQLTAPHSKDWEDQAIEREGEEVLESLSQADRDELRGIDAALARMRDNTYGDCVNCGEKISEARLTVLPDSPFCRRCAQSTEVDLFENVPI